MAEAVPLTRRRRATAALLALLLALPFFVRLAGAPLFDVDEGAFSEATREMLASGDWLHTTLNGADRFDKPIGVYWLQALAAQVFGLGEFAMRLPCALAAWAMALAVVAFCRPRFGDRPAWVAGFIVATSFGVQMIGRAATADALLNLLIVLAACDLWRHSQSNAVAPLRRAFFWMALGFLVKGPVAVLVPGAALGVWLLASRRWDVLRSTLRDPWAWTIFVAVALPWYAYALHRHGMAFVDGFLLRHNVGRFGAPMQGHAGSKLYYLVVVPLLALPWSPLLAGVIARARDWWREPLGRFLLAWSGFVLVFFTLAATKLPHYALYGYAPLAMLMARVFDEAGRKMRLALWIVLVAWACAAAVLPWFILAPQGMALVRDPFYRALLSGLAEPAAAAPAIVLIVLAVLLALAVAKRVASAPLAGALAVSLLIAGWAIPWWGEVLQGPVRRAAQAAAAHGARTAGAAQWGTNLPSFAFYLGRPVPLRMPTASEFALVRADRWPADAAARPRIFEERGIILLGPEPTR
ncbi:MAG TPA: glycosyltransferase family 39 protein [Ramlibacter sp.]|uniref:ArnT family glycosyltransferase n=1 Tax=Ramlibacter sp. TaxID=1917967 RepID=UPI002BB619A4|nr:glycosyltransferase family 39 protein [Ramlibacter sp.]HVZ46784.1 glycosyltransferase family 39 protein [Ramlibacter sp.]